MINKPFIIAAIAAMAVLSPANCPAAQPAAKGSLSPELLEQLRANYTPSAPEKALRNALAANPIDALAGNTDALSRPVDYKHFTHRVPSKGITNQRSSGRCWLFTGLNVLRAQMMNKHNLPMLELSQNYNFFYDQLEKANLFLQAVAETAADPMDSRRVEWLFKNPLSDGGQFTGLSDNIMKYGVVPAEAMPETASSNATSGLNRALSTLLRRDGLALRQMKAKGATDAQMQTEINRMLGDVYHVLTQTLGQPPVEFTWTRRTAAGTEVDTRTYTPQEFYREYAGNNLKDNYVMLMNDPSRPYWKLYEIDLDRHTFDGKNWTYVNLPVDEIKKMAIASLADSTAMYFSCDVGKDFNRKRGLLDPDNYDYGSLLGVDMKMDKTDRIRSFASASSHAMTLVAVNLDKNGKPDRWMVENSWGPGVNDGHLVMTDPWFDEYMFRLVVDRKYVPAKVLKVLDQQPTVLPAWDPMFAPEN